MTSIRDLQYDAVALCAKYPKANTERYGLAIAEEAGEVCRAILKRALGIRGTYARWTEEIQKETCDLIVTLIMLAVIEDFDLENAITTRMTTLLGRPVDHDPIT